MKFAVADSIKTTSGIIAIIFLVSFGILFILMDVFGVRSKFCGQTKVKTQRNAKNKMGKIVKPIYVVKQTK